jgi:hypothetical protein
VLVQNSNEVRLTLSAKMNSFLQEFYDYSTLSSSTLSGRTSSTALSSSPATEPPSHLNQKNVSAILNIVAYLRRQPLPPHLATGSRGKYFGTRDVLDIRWAGYPAE